MLGRNSNNKITAAITLTLRDAYATVMGLKPFGAKLESTRCLMLSLEHTNGYVLPLGEIPAQPTEVGNQEIANHTIPT